MADELFGELRPHIEGQAHLHLAGHSLGGSLATLMALTAHLRLGGGGGGSSSEQSDASSSSGTSGSDSSRSNSTAPPAATAPAEQAPPGGGLRVQCTTFGSPPVLALESQDDEDGRSILRALRLPPGSVRNYVLQVNLGGSDARTLHVCCSAAPRCCRNACRSDNSLLGPVVPFHPHVPQDDPVPRALLSADPAFLALKQTPAVAGLLRLREQWLGQGVLSPTRFLFHPAGDVYLVRCVHGRPVLAGEAHCAALATLRAPHPLRWPTRPCRSWSAEGGHSVRLLDPRSLQEDLRLDVATLRSSPVRLVGWPCLERG